MCYSGIMRRGVWQDHDWSVCAVQAFEKWAGTTSNQCVSRSGTPSLNKGFTTPSVPGSNRSCIETLLKSMLAPCVKVKVWGCGESRCQSFSRWKEHIKYITKTQHCLNNLSQVWNRNNRFIVFQSVWESNSNFYGDTIIYIWTLVWFLYSEHSVASVCHPEFHLQKSIGVGCLEGYWWSCNWLTRIKGR